MKQDPGSPAAAPEPVDARLAARLAGLRGDLVEGRLAAGADLACDGPSVPGPEQQIRVLEGALEVTARDVAHRPDAGDCPRLRVWGPARSRCAGPADARYVLAVVRP